MFLECADAFASLLCGVDSELAATLVMAVRRLSNGVDRIERCESVPSGIAPAELGYVPLPSPFPDGLADLACAAGESADGATGWCRSVTDDVIEVVLVCGVSQGGD